MKPSINTCLCLITLLALSSAACHRDATVSTDRADRATTSGDRGGSASADGWMIFGSPLAAQLQTTDVADVLAEPAAYAGRDVQLRGTIAEVCQSRGCWVRIADASGGEETVFVKFTCPVEGERLIPLDAVGKPVVVQGQLVIEEMDEAAARHYATDAGKSPEEVAAIIGPQKTIRVMSPSARVGH